MDSVLLFFITVLLVAEQMTLQECHRLIFPEPIRNLPVHPDRVLHLNFLLPADQKKPDVISLLRANSSYGPW